MYHQEDWGTCPCIICVNPELKLESVKKVLPQISLTIDDLVGDTSMHAQVTQKNRKSGKTKLRVYKYTL